MARQAGAVRDQVARGDAFRSAGIGQREPGNVPAQRHIPFQAARIDQRAHGECGKGLGRRTDGHNGVGRHGCFFLQVAIAVAFGQDDFIVHDNGHGQAGNVQSLQPFGHNGIESSQGNLGLGRGAVAAIQLESESLAALDETTAELGAVGAETALESRLTRNSGDGKGYFVVLDNNAGQGQVLGILSGMEMSPSQEPSAWLMKSQSISSLVPGSWMAPAQCPAKDGVTAAGSRTVTNAIKKITPKNVLFILHLMNNFVYYTAKNRYLFH